jgi:hypothetical protein
MRTDDTGRRQRTSVGARGWPVNVYNAAREISCWYYLDRKSLLVYDHNGRVVQLPVRGLVGALRRRGLIPEVK